MKLTVREMVVFAMLGALMYVSKLVMEFAPNIHLLGVFTMAFTIVYRKKALYPVYINVFLMGMFSGFATWWLPHLYEWGILWGITMLLPGKMSARVAAVVYMMVCGIHGLLYGTLYAPMQALVYGLNMESMISWIIAGLPFDLVHGISNFFCGILVLPIVSVLTLAEKGIRDSEAGSRI